MGRVLSLVERGGERAREVARLSYRFDPPYTIGITGAAGAGKSTLTNRLIPIVREGWSTELPGGARSGARLHPPEGDGAPGGRVALQRVAVLAVDPTSPFSGGAILGDRVRMQDHATDPSVFIRSMATRGHVGGLALAVPDALRALGAASFPVVLLETVGVGQVEVEVASSADTTVVVVTPGWGDAVQTAKAGLLEVADVFVINKADRPGVREARRDLEQMLDLSPTSEWRPPIVETAASTGEGVEELWSTISRHSGFLEERGELDSRRRLRVQEELRRVVTARLGERARAVLDEPASSALRKELQEGAIDPYDAADLLLEQMGLPPQ